MADSELTQLIRELESSRFYGVLEIKFECGKIVLLRKTETIKLTDYRETRGEQNERTCE